MNPDIPPNPNSLPHLIKELRDETTTLMRQEVSLAKAELKENASHLTSHALQIAVGGFVAYAGVIVLLIGIGHLLGALLTRAGLDPDVAAWLAPTLVGLIIALVGWGMLSRAKKALAHDDIMPRRTIDSLRTNKDWAQSKLQHSP
jgi:flagellar motor component MotA